MTESNKMLIEELEKRLLWYREIASADEFDADEVDAICTMLLKLSPDNEPRRTKEEAYRNIMGQIRLEEGDSEGKEAKGSSRHSIRHFFSGKRKLRAAVIILVAAGAVASLNMVSYARENKSLFTMILERVGWLEIEKDTEEAEFNTGMTAEKFYESWTELDPAVKQKITVPGYIPAGYSLYGIKGWHLNNREILQAEYYNQGNGHLLIEITLWEKNADQYRENVPDEEGCVLIPEYSDENTLYYTYEDEYICLAFRENSFCRISGNITLEEMVKTGGGI